MIKDSYPLTNIQEISHSLQGATVFLSLDTCRAYNAVRIECVQCTAFISPFGTFQYIGMPFGLANAGSVYSRMLDVIPRQHLDLHTVEIPWAISDILLRLSWYTRQLESRYNPAKPSCSSLRWSTWGTRLAKEDSL